MTNDVIVLPLTEQTAFAMIAAMAVAREPVANDNAGSVWVGADWRPFVDDARRVCTVQHRAARAIQPVVDGTAGRGTWIVYDVHARRGLPVAVQVGVDAPASRAADRRVAVLAGILSAMGFDARAERL